MLYIDLERKFDPVRARALGIDIDKNFLLVTTNEQMRTAENAMDIIIAAAQSKAIGLVIVDSIQAMSPQGEQETKKGKELDMAHDEMALLAKKMSKFYARINPYMANVALVMVGQARDTGLGTFMVKEGLSGGRSGKHWATIILHFRRGQGVNAPKEYEYNSAGEIVRDKNGEKVSHYVGFEMVVGLEKMHISGGAMEKSELRMTFYYKSGLFMPDEKEPRANANDGGAPATPSSCTDNKVAEAKPTGKKRGPKPKVKEEAK